MSYQNVPAILHFTTGFPVVVGLRHIENLSKVRVSEPGQAVTICTGNNEFVRNFGLMNGYHHYVIATRPRCMILEKSFYWNSKMGIGYGVMEFEIGYKKYKELPFQLILDGSCPYPFPSVDGQLKSHKDIELVTVEKSIEGYPNRFMLHTNSGKRFGYFLEPDFLHFIKFDERESDGILDFRIEYIGISTGETGNLDFGDRLRNHEKVIEIGSYIQRDHPNRQVYIFGYQAQYSIEAYPNNYIDNSRMLETFLPGGIKSWAEVLEASLIRHFQPKYNVEFKGFLETSFPHWLGGLREILAPSYENRPAIISASIFSDNLLNADGSWKFGDFYTEHTKIPRNFVQTRFDISSK